MAILETRRLHTMVKGAPRGKSSATAATRKKQAAKAAAKHGGGAPAKDAAPGGGKRRTKKEKQAQKKKYVPPPKPPQPAPNPLEALGLAHLLPADLVVLLRKAVKKDVVTRVRSLEALLAWTQGRAAPDERDAAAQAPLSYEERCDALVLMVPCWVYLFPRLALSPSQRLRMLALQIHAELLAPPRAGSGAASVREELLAPANIEAIASFWAILAHDSSRAVARLGRSLWDDCVSWDSGASDRVPVHDLLGVLMEQLRPLLLSGSPAASLALITPALQVVGGGDDRAPLERDAKNRDSANVDESGEELDRRLAAGALGTLDWLIETCPDMSLLDLDEFAGSAQLWSALRPEGHEDGAVVLGVDAALVRQRAWSLLRLLLTRAPALVAQHLEVLAPQALAGAWIERDVGVQQRMLGALLPLLRAHPDAWLARGEQGDESEEEEEEEEEEQEEHAPQTAPALAGFYAWVQDVCPRSPQACLPAVLVFLSTMPAAVLPPTEAAATAMAGALVGASETLVRGGAVLSAAGWVPYVSMLCESLAFLATRIARDGGSPAAGAHFAAEQLQAVWHEFVLGLPRGDGTPPPALVLLRKAADTLGRRLAAFDVHVGDVWLLGDFLPTLEEEVQKVALAEPTEGEEREPTEGEEQPEKLAMEPRAAAAARGEAAITTVAALLDSIAAKPGSDRLCADVHALCQRLVNECAGTLLQKHSAQTLDPVTAARLTKSLAALLGSGAAAPDTALAEVVTRVVPALLATDTVRAEDVAALLVAYLRRCADRGALDAAWRALLGATVPSTSSEDARVLSTLLRVAQQVAPLDGGAKLPSDDILAPWREQVGDAARMLVQSGANSAASPIVLELLCAPAELLQDEAKQPIVHALATRLEQDAERLWRAPHGDEAQAVRTSIRALAEWHAGAPQQHGALLCADAELARALPAVYALAYTAPAAGDEAAGQDALPAVSADAQRLWAGVAAAAEADAQTGAQLDQIADEALRTQLLSGAQPPRRVLAAAAGRRSVRQAHPMERMLHVLPDRERMDAALAVAAHHAPDAKLAVHDVLVPLESSAAETSAEDLAPLGRAVRAYLAALELDAALAASVLWAVPHMVYVATALEDALLLGDEGVAHALCGAEEVEADASEDAAPRAVWRSAAQAQLLRLIHATTRLLTAAVVDLPEAWHAAVTGQLRAGAGPDGASTADALAAVVHTVWAQAVEAAPAAGDAARVERVTPTAVAYARVFARLLSGVLGLSSAPVQAGEAWLRLAVTVRSKAPTPLVGGVLVAASAHARDAPLYERVRSELVAALSGVPAAQANGEGARLLQLVACAAPAAASGVPLVPTQRAVFLLQALQRWLASDEELGEALFARLAQLFVELAPVVQTVAGRHFDLMLDVAEENLQALALEEAGSWPTLYHTLRLLATLQDLRRSSEHVHEALSAHREALDAAVHDTLLALCERAAALPEDAEPSEAANRCIALAVELSEQLPAERFGSEADQRVLAQLLGHASACTELQVAAYRWLSAATQARVRDEVVEQAVGGEDEKRPAPQLTPALVAHASRGAPADAEEVLESATAARRVFAYLLVWLALLDHFAEASLQLKALFAAELQRDELIAQLLPGVFALVGGAKQRLRPLDAGRIAIDEVALEELEPRSARALQVLAAHVYYRVLLHLPTQVRDWYLGVRDRQLSLLVGSFTGKFCTPMLAERELQHIREPEALARLQDEAMSVKVLSSNEVVATYTVDEYPMEIGVRIPAEYPLRGVEIRDIKRVGVSEAQWRAWLLAVQQLVSGKNGLILDALTLFKKNAELKFQGYEGAECAICYSIISPTDHSLPSKPCRTCRKRFHASCLYKWVSTSGASTCPLCRSIL